MKIGLVCPYDMYKGGGVQECVLALQKELSNRGHKVKIVTPVPPTVKDPRQDSIIFIGNGMQMKTPGHTTVQISISADNELITNMLEEEKFDILHFHEPWIPVISRQILSRSTAVNVATFHAKLPDTVIVQTLAKLVTPYTKSIIKYLSDFTAVSPAASEYVGSLTGKRIIIIPNGIDLSKYHKMNIKRDQNILYIGRLEKRKGVKHLIDAFCKINNTKSRLIIAGDGVDRLKLEKYVTQKQVRDRVDFLGYVSEKQKLELLAKSGVFCSPALFGESFGIVLLEAMAMGLPIVAGNNPGYSSVLTGFGANSLINPRSVNEFSGMLDRFLADDDLRSDWQEWANKSISQYDYVKIVDGYEKFYHEALDCK
ncbi:MAG: glycosyltransferase family 4 protein [Candidatus Saccharimonadales bacterium]